MANKGKVRRMEERICNRSARKQRKFELWMHKKYQDKAVSADGRNLWMGGISNFPSDILVVKNWIRHNVEKNLYRVWGSGVEEHKLYSGFLFKVRERFIDKVYEHEKEIGGYNRTWYCMEKGSMFYIITPFAMIRRIKKALDINRYTPTSFEWVICHMSEVVYEQKKTRKKEAEERSDV